MMRQLYFIVSLDLQVAAQIAPMFYDNVTHASSCYACDQLNATLPAVSTKTVGAQTDSRSAVSY